jgi:hypothetical protein
MTGGDADAIDPDLEAMQASLGESNRGRHVAWRQHHGKRHGACARGQIDTLILCRHLGRQGREGCRGDDHGQDRLRVAAMLGQQELGLAPSGRGPFRGDDKDDKLAMIDGCLQCCLPAIAGDQPAFRVRIKEDIVTALRFHPVANRDGFRIVGTRMT